MLIKVWITMASSFFSKMGKLWHDGVKLLMKQLIINKYLYSAISVHGALQKKGKESGPCSKELYNLQYDKGNNRGKGLGRWQGKRVRICDWVDKTGKEGREISGSKALKVSTRSLYQIGGYIGNQRSNTMKGVI